LDLTSTVLFSGVLFGLCILACHSLFKRGFGSSWARRAQLAALLITFVTGIASSLVYYTTTFAIIAAHLNPQLAAIQTSDFFPFGIALYWSQQIGLLINDIVVIWRAWVLYQGRPVVLCSLCLPFCATLAISFAALALVSQVTVFGETAAVVSSSETSTQSSMADTLNNAATALSLATNLYATTLIFIQLWKHRRLFNRSGLHWRSLTSSQRILLFLVEAGFIFCIAQAADFSVHLYLNTNNNNTIVAYFTLELIDDVLWASMPIYLPVIILLVENNRTIADTFSFDSKFLADVEAASHQEGGPESS